jgi:ribonuclease P/MRP protein subunit RPP1
VYEAVHARPAGRSSVARFAGEARAAGFAGVVVRDREATVPAGAAGDVVRGATVDAAPGEASGRVGALRDETTLLLVRGGTRARNRFAVEEARVDVLAAPTGPHASEACPFGEAAARAAARNGVRVEFDLGPVLRAAGGTRVRAIDALSRLHDAVTAYDAPHVVSAAPASHLALRDPRALAAVGEAVGLPAGFVREGLREWGRLAARNRDRAGEDWVMPGVRRGRYDPADWEGEP